MKISKITLIISLVVVTMATVFLSFPAPIAKADECALKAEGASCNNGQGNCQTYSMGEATAIRCVPNGQTVDKTTGKTAQEQKKIDQGLGGVILNGLFELGFKVIDSVMYGVFYVLGKILELAGAFFDFVLTRPEFQQFTLSPVVKIGWVITRNIANMFFALVILIISFATILRIESYGVKQVLPKLIIAAILINFSLVIAGVMIDFSQVLTKFFSDSALKGSAGASLSATIVQNMRVTQGIQNETNAVNNAVANKQPIKLSETIDGMLASVINLFAGCFVMLLAAFVFFAGFVFLLIRYIALLFLLILAPIVWVFYILPATRSYWSQWWHTFFKWLMFAPAYAFFLYLSMTIIKSNLFSQVGANSTKNFGGYTIPVMVNFAIIIGFLIGSLIVAQKSGVMGANAVINVGKSIGKWGGRNIGYWAAKGAPMPKIVAPALSALGLKGAAARWEKATAPIAKVMGAPKRVIAPLFVPDVWRRAWSARRARSEARNYSQAAGQLDDILSGRWKKGSQIMAERARSSEVAKKQDEFSKIYKDEDRAIDAYKTMKDPIEKEAMLRLVTSINGLNTLMVAEKGESDPATLHQYLRDVFKDEAGRIGADLSAISAAGGNFGMIGMGKWDSGRQEFRSTSIQERLDAIKQKMGEWEPQDWARRVHPDAFFGLTKDPATGRPIRDKELHDGGEVIIKNITENHVGQVNRLQGRTVEALYNGRESIRKTAQKDLDDHKIDQTRFDTIERFIKAVEEKYVGKGGKPATETPFTNA